MSDSNSRYWTPNTFCFLNNTGLNTINLLQNIILVDKQIFVYSVMEKQWQTKLIQNVTSILTKKVEVWSQILEKLGIESINLCEYTEAVERNTAQLYDAMIAELEKELIAVTQDIQELLQKSEKLCKQLSIDIPCYGQEQEHLSLFQQHRLLKEQVMKQQVMVEERLAEVTIYNF